MRISPTNGTQRDIQNSRRYNNDSAPAIHPVRPAGWLTGLQVAVDNARAFTLRDLGGLT